MKNNLFQIWFDGDEMGRGIPFHIVELPAAKFPDLDALQEAVADNALIRGEHIDSRWGMNRGERIVTARSPILFRGASVQRVTVPTWTFAASEELRHTSERTG